MKKVLLIGKTGSGKTSLIQKIVANEIKYKKTQSLEIISNFIDSPGEYIENQVYLKALIITAVNVDIIALLEDCTQETSYIPPKFTSAFNNKSIGIITKIELAKNPNNIAKAEKRLKEAGCKEIFKVSAFTGEGIDKLVDYLNDVK